MKAIAQLAVCALLAAFFTILFVAAMACSPIGFVGFPLTVLIFGSLLAVFVHVIQVEWGT